MKKTINHSCICIILFLSSCLEIITKSASKTSDNTFYLNTFVGTGAMKTF